MDSLAEYVANLLRQGYQEAQIRQYLTGLGYPQSAIEAAFTASRPVRERRPGTSSYTVIDQLAAYLKTWMAQGYPLEQLKATLLQEGYASRDVEAAIARVTGVKVEHHVPFATVAKLALLAIIIVGAFFFFKSMTKSPPLPEQIENRLLDVTLSLNKDSFTKGDSLLATTTVVNLGKGMYDVQLTYQLLDDYDTKLWSERVTKAVSTSFEDTQSVALNFPPGTYRLKVVARYGGEAPASASTSFTIKESGEESGGERKHVGHSSQNKSEETPSTKIYVLKDEPQEDALDEAFAQAKKGNSGGAEKTCLAITNQARRDSCLGTIATFDHQASHCSKITSESERDKCLMSFVITGNYELCDQLSKSENKELCENLKALSQTPPPQTTQPDINDFAQTS